MLDENLWLEEFPEGDAGGDGDVEGFFGADHGDFQDVVAVVQDFGWDAKTLFSKKEYRVCVLAE